MKNAILFSSILALAGCFSESDSSESSTPKEQPPTYTLDLDLTGSQYAAYRANEGDWIKLEAKETSLVYTEKDTEIDLVVLCDGSHHVDQIILTENRAIDWDCVYNMPGSFDKTINISTPNNYEVLSVASSNSKYSRYIEPSDDPNLHTIAYDSELSTHSLAILAKRISDDKQFLYKKNGLIFEDQMTIDVSFDQDNTWELTEFDPSRPDIYPYFLRVEFEDNMVFALSGWTESFQWYFHKLPESYSLDKYFYIEELHFGHGSEVIRGSKEILTDKVQLGFEPKQEISKEAIRVSQDKKGFSFPDYDTSYLPQEFDRDYFKILINEDSFRDDVYGPTTVYKVDSDRLFGDTKYVKLIDYTELPEYPYADVASEMSIETLYISLHLSNGKAFSEGGATIELGTYGGLLVDETRYSRP